MKKLILSAAIILGSLSIQAANPCNNFNDSVSDSSG